MHQQELKHQLGDMVTNYMRTNHITLDDVADKVIAVCSDTSRKGVINRVSSLRRGAIYGKGHPNNYHTVGKMREKFLERTAILLYAMDIPIDHPIISNVRSIDCQFVYPPKVHP